MFVVSRFAYYDGSFASMYLSQSSLQHLKQVQAQLNRLHPEAEPQVLPLVGSPRPERNVIIFTGSFNPPTIAHLALLKQAWRFARAHGNMQLYAAFSKRTVDKESLERPLLLDRVTLFERILRRRLPNSGILLFNRGLYVEQARALRFAFPAVRRIFFLMGFDKIVQILDPRYYNDRDAALTELFSLAELLVAPRGDAGEQELQALLRQPQNQVYARSIHATPLDQAYRDISSTQIRQEKTFTTHDVPQEVREFLRKTRAYAPSVQRVDGTLIDSYEERVSELRRLLRTVVL
jgi:nicotinic acid mononucleotide adenylyltransferase